MDSARPTGTYGHEFLRGFVGCLERSADRGIAHPKSRPNGLVGNSLGTQDSLNVTATANNQLSASGYAYDSPGNMTADGANTYGYNAESKIKSAAGVNYTYDGDGNRLQKSNGKIYWYGAGTEILDESAFNGTFTSEYVFFGGKRIARRDVSSGNIYYYEEDMLGSSRTVALAGGTSPCYDSDFRPFGSELSITNSCLQSYKFEGKELDTETLNDDFGARYYSWRIGRKSPVRFKHFGCCQCGATKLKEGGSRIEPFNELGRNTHLRACIHGIFKSSFYQWSMPPEFLSRCLIRLYRSGGRDEANSDPPTEYGIESGNAKSGKLRLS